MGHKKSQCPRVKNTDQQKQGASTKDSGDAKANVAWGSRCEELNEEEEEEYSFEGPKGHVYTVSEGASDDNSEPDMTVPLSSKIATTRKTRTKRNVPSEIR